MGNQDYEKKEGFVQTHKNNNKIQKGRKNIKSIILAVPIVIGLMVFIGPKALGMQEKEPEILTTSTLRKIINVSELSTFQAVYNGVAEVRNEKNPEKLDYNVSYEAKVNAGFDYNKVKIENDEQAKIITIEIPEIVFTNVEVDIASLEYMFQNDKANVSAVSAQAYSACIEDVTNESKQESAIIDLAEQNAQIIMKALISPFMDQFDAEYKLVVTVGGA